MKQNAKEECGKQQKKNNKNNTTKTTNQIYRCIYINRLEHAMHTKSRTPYRERDSDSNKQQSQQQQLYNNINSAIQFTGQGNSSYKMYISTCYELHKNLSHDPF